MHNYLLTVNIFLQHRLFSATRETFRSYEYFIGQISGGSSAYNLYTVGEICRVRAMTVVIVPNRVFLMFLNELIQKICKI